ncbi:asparagine synthase (glutamine-hydrolyzing) [Bradyrhizobium sp.]|uniref:asparagine synthase (glutamine-hydrolyzing) n=1 Tax=Bradyrhizobium sp. TaxID=376 RepID=UPI0023A5FCE3|nr:asparagine synthase (glutamine-hydrolyzing) [Bradyrhizobium sp.]MDE2379513.1 asparagine synthase (glutamine-hydrolyzing) [Bradyrhizobium sp.]
MCGIAGFVGRGDQADLLAMTRALQHRGPDDEGFHVDPELRVFLGHRRLAIRDIAGGRQPMWNASGTVCVVYNGEIYNHETLRAELEAKGHVFVSSHSDTEVLVHGYAEWGTGLAARLNGMFAFAVLDTARRRLYLARDRFGEKPLYYAQRQGLFAFASELSALVRHRDIPALPSLPTLRKLFAYGYLPAPHALYEGTAKLPGGHFMTVDLVSLETSVTAYWRFVIEPDEDMARRGEAALAEELRELLVTATERRLVSDVGIGIFLSGGLDSSMVLAAAARRRAAREIDTFTIGFTEPSYDESAFARTVADHVGSRHHERVLGLDAARDLIPSVLSRLDEPSADASILPTHMLSAFAREQVTVALSGDGGDELFAGYDPFVALKPAVLYAAVVPAPVHAALRVMAERLPRSSRNMSLDFKVRRTLMGLSQPEAAWAPAWMAPIDPEAIGELFAEPVRPEDLFSEAMELWESGEERTRVDRLLQFFTTFYLQDDILAKVDRASMMCSLETRAVFLDNDVVEFCRRLPSRFKYRNGRRKHLLKKALEPLLPRAIIERKKKGFGIPLAAWMRQVPDTPPFDPVPGIRPAWMRQAWQDHRAGRADHRLALWTWLSLQHTLRAAGSGH